MKLVNQTQRTFADTIIKNWDDSIYVIKHPRSKMKLRAKNMPNEAKLSITRNGLFTDSYPPSVPAKIERISRFHADVFLDCVLNDTNPIRRGINIQGCHINLTGASISGLIQIIKRDKLKEMRCVCCGIKAKYVYVERHLIVGQALKNHYLVLVGVDKVGVEQKLTVDHIQAKATGGSHKSVTNMQVLCAHCNSIKQTIPNDQFMHAQEILQTVIQKSKLKEAA